ncbi:MAG: cytochrome P450 [Myxococcota bacterium]
MTEVPRATSSKLWTTWKLLRQPYAMWPPLAAQHGKTFRIDAWNGDIVCTADPDVLRDLFKATTDEVRPFAVDALLPVLGADSVIAIWGARHKEARRLLMPSFHGPRMKAYTERMREITLRTSARWGEVPGAEIVALDEMLSISLEVIARAVFGIDDAAEVTRHTDAIRAFVRTLRPELLFVPAMLKLPVGPGPRFLRAKEAFDAMLHRTIRERRAGERGDDVLSMLLDATHADGGAVDDDEVRDQLVTLLFAGHETTQIAMAWMLYHLARHPEARARLEAEVDGWDGVSDTLGNLPYLDAVVQETLRMHAIVPDFVRTLVTPMTLGPYTLPAGTHVAMIAAMLHADPALYPDPDAFRPERHLERTFKPYELIPFGGGVRRCIGAALATWEMKVVVATLIQRFRFDSRSDEAPVRRNATAGPRHGVRLAVSRRASPATA